MCIDKKLSMPFKMKIQSLLVCMIDEKEKKKKDHGLNLKQTPWSDGRFRKCFYNTLLKL